MSVALMERVWQIEALTTHERIVLLCLADHANDDGESCYPPIARICKRTSMGERGVQNVLLRLIEMGHVTLRKGGGRGRANEYRVHPKAENPAPDAGIEPENPAPETPFLTTKPRTGCGVTEETPHLVTENPAPDAGQPSVTIIKEEKRVGASRRKPELPLPDNWTPSDRNLSDARSRDLSDQDIRNEADRFRNYHLARDSRFRDWDAAWRTWLGNVRQFSSGRMAGPAFAGGGRRGGSLASIAARRRAEGAV